jgi:hypothetical protein
MLLPDTITKTHVTLWIFALIFVLSLMEGQAIGAGPVRRSLP